MSQIDIEILLNKSECKVLRKLQESQKIESNHEKVRMAYLQNLKKQNLIFRIVLSLITVLGIITLITPSIWYSIFAFGIILGIVGFIPGSIWLLFFSKYKTGFDIYYDHMNGR